jgi:hypothetical protein
MGAQIVLCERHGIIQPKTPTAGGGYATTAPTTWAPGIAQREGCRRLLLAEVLAHPQRVLDGLGRCQPAERVEKPFGLGVSDAAIGELESLGIPEVQL